MRSFNKNLAIVFILLIVFFLSPPPGGMGAPQPASLLKKARECRSSLLKSPNKMKYRHNWEKCIDLFTGIHTRFPASDEAAWGLYYSGDLYVGLYKYSGRQTDLDRAVRLYRELADNFEEHRLADDAQYRIGEIYYRLKQDPAQAYVEYLKADIRFPSGDMRPKTRAMLDKLAVLLSKKDTGASPPAPESRLSELTLLKEIRHWSTLNYTRVVIDMEKPVKYVSELLKEDPGLNKPKRLYVDLRKSYVNSDITTSIPIQGSLLECARAGQYDRETVRVVLDINNIKGYKIFHLYDPFRIVIDVNGSEAGIGANTAEGNKTAKGPGRSPRRGIRKVKEPDPSISLARQLGLHVNKIVLDPGHGGKDPGCYLNNRVKEKAIVLKLSKILAEKIRKELGCEVLLTRATDTFLSLEQRTAFANVNKADLFVSLHVNSYRNARISGLETYFLNMATDERAVMVAARENATSEKNISDLQAILNDLMLNTKISESSRLAHEVQEGMINEISRRYKSAPSLGVKQAPFYVLIGAEMPAILVETGFITNPTDRKRLLSDKYLHTLAEGISKGIGAYIKSIEQVYRGG